MRECWNGDKESRPTFQELKEEFDGLISHAERYKYVMPLGSVAAEAGLIADPAEAGLIADPAEAGLIADLAEAGLIADPAEGPVHDQPTSSSDCEPQAHLEAASEDSTG